MQLQRLKTRAEMQRVLRAGTTIKSRHFALHKLYLPEQETVVAAAALLPKRLAKRAVTRNSIRRLVYMNVYQHRQQLAGFHLVVRLRKNFTAAGFVSATSKAFKQQVNLELQQMLQQLIADKGVNYA